MVPQGSMLNQAITIAGGPKILRGRLNLFALPQSQIERRIFRYNPKAVANSHNNPVLMSGDLITIGDSPLSAAAEVMDEFARPIFGAYTIQSIFSD